VREKESEKARNSRRGRNKGERERGRGRRREEGEEGRRETRGGGRIGGRGGYLLSWLKSMKRMSVLFLFRRFISWTCTGRGRRSKWGRKMKGSSGRKGK